MKELLKPSVSRRDFAKVLAAAVPLAATVTAAAAQGSDSGMQQDSVDAENTALDKLHKAALAEGGKLVVYGGGDLPNGGAGMEKAFAGRFPGMTARIITDRSKLHGARIDNQISLGKVECDVAHILTTNLYEKWKEESRLLPYRPLAWDKLYPDFRDPDATYVAMTIFAFSTVYNTAQVKEEEAPRDFVDFLDPKWKGKIVLGYPHDDDAMLYQYERIIATHGWEYMTKLMAQDVVWVRGSAPARQMVAKGEKAVTFCASGTLDPAADATFHFIIPRADSFLAWAQPVAIFRDTARPAAAKLYVNWLLSSGLQASSGRWPVRRDIPTQGGYGPITDYNAYPQHYRALLADRAKLERLRDQLELYIGQAQGPNPTGVSGIYLTES